MDRSGPGKGVLVPTGKHAPAVSVDYEINHRDAESGKLDGLKSSRKLAAVRFLTEESGERIPLGDYDLLVGDKIIRLKHTADDPEWLVLSSFA